ncbi:hypothetical protein DD238_002791 [Peronospora effusa]|uniref:Uncharacterized protein n=1 Tax=Peronospora effusa TaxID=542832 RepID=A0A3M6VPR3_9STRA|nr:hypothetical protein DD238_002791 [Peronospora effusa]
MLFSTVTAIDVRNLTSSSSLPNSGLPIAAVVGIVAAVAVMVLVAMKVRRPYRPEDLELHEVVISPSQAGEQPLFTKKHYVYTAHI